LLNATASAGDVLISFRSAYGSFSAVPFFYFASGHLSVCDGDTLFGPLNLSLEPSLCALVGRNGSGKTRLLRLLAGLDEPANGHIERTGTQVYVAQQQDILPHTTLAELLGYEASSRRERVSTAESISLTIWKRLMASGI
jgi:ATPase subunit of ABC transporter with duplicated ATPase domains